jgi:hypothetical protein
MGLLDVLTGMRNGPRAALGEADKACHPLPWRCLVSLPTRP